MKKYKQLTSGQRYQIDGLKQAGLNQTRTAQKIGVDKSTILREFRQNKGQRSWRPKQAQSLRDQRRQACINGKQFSSGSWVEVERLIRGGLSPEQAANRLENENNNGLFRQYFPKGMELTGVTEEQVW
ncbi:MAG: Helix-turn-helix domain-containing protein [Candidatus Nitrotoga sp. LAW]|nr:MAG: Helix-turn-helix domain-containing protein [Candidatus Nitrotoga sp. LAW]